MIHGRSPVTRVTFAQLSPALTFLWLLLLDLGAERPGAWCLVGDQLIALHAREHARTDVHTEADAALLIDVGQDPGGLRQITDFVLARSFETHAAADELTHRFVCKVGREGVILDLIEAGSADSVVLRRSQLVQVRVDSSSGQLLRPDLLGAVISKVNALERPDDARRHDVDLALLLSLMRDPAELSADVTTAERDSLRACVLLNRRHPAWRSLTNSEADSGHAALRLLARM